MASFEFRLGTRLGRMTVDIPSSQTLEQLDVTIDFLGRIRQIIADVEEAEADLMRDGAEA